MKTIDWSKQFEEIFELHEQRKLEPRKIVNPKLNYERPDEYGMRTNVFGDLENVGW